MSLETDFPGQIGADGQRHAVASAELTLPAISDVKTIFATGATEALDTSAYALFLVTMDAPCTFSFVNPNPVGHRTVFEVLLRAGKTDEVQLLTVGGAGLISFVITHLGQPTASIPAAATPAQVQAAMIALSNVAEGDLTVGGSVGAWTLNWTGDVDVPAVTVTPTGGSGTVTVTTPTAGGVEFEPTWPASVDWPDGTPLLFDTPSLFSFLSVDAGTTWLGRRLGKAFA